MSRPPFETAHLDELDRLSGEFDTIPVRIPLGISAFGVNAYGSREAGGHVIEEHDELGAGAGRHEELYVVLAGRATFTVAGEELDAPAGTLVFVRDPATRRAATAAEPDTTVLVVGGTVGKAVRARRRGSRGSRRGRSTTRRTTTRPPSSSNAPWLRTPTTRTSSTTSRAARPSPVAGTRPSRTWPAPWSSIRGRGSGRRQDADLDSIRDVASRRRRARGPAGRATSGGWAGGSSLAVWRDLNVGQGPSVRAQSAAWRK